MNKTGAVVLVAAGAGVLVYALVGADLLAVILWWAFGNVQPSGEIAGSITLGIIGVLLVGGGVALWNNQR